MRRPWLDRAMLRGRIHGRLMLVLVAVAVLASGTAIWQFSANRDDREPDLAAIDAGRTTALPEPASEPAGTVESTSAAPSPTASPSPSASATSRPPETSAAPTTEAAPAGPQCTASLTLDHEWNGSVSVTVTVANTGPDRIGGWEVELDIKHLDVTGTWGLSHIEGHRYGDVFFNGGVDPGDSVEPSFQADVNGRYEIPASVPCTPV